MSVKIRVNSYGQEGIKIVKTDLFSQGKIIHWNKQDMIKICDKAGGVILTKSKCRICPTDDGEVVVSYYPNIIPREVS